MSGSLQALDLVNGVLLARGDTVIIEQETYQGTINRLTRLGVTPVGIPLDRDGMRIDALAAALDDLKRARHAAEIHLHHPDRAESDRHDHDGGAARASCCGSRSDYGVPVFEDDCYADLIWDGRAPAGDLCHEQDRQRDPHRLVLEVDRAGAARRLHRRAPGTSCRARSRSRPMPAPARSSRWCWRNSARRISPTHVPGLRRGLRAKLEALMDALNEQFGTAAEFDDPKGGIFLWVKLPDQRRHA